MKVSPISLIDIGSGYIIVNSCRNEPYFVNLQRRRVCKCDFRKSVGPFLLFPHYFVGADVSRGRERIALTISSGGRFLPRLFPLGRLFRLGYFLRAEEKKGGGSRR